MSARLSREMSRPSKMIEPDVRVEQAHDAARHRRLAAAGLADDAERLALGTVKLTPSTAWTAATCFWKMIPRVTGKCLARLSTTSGSLPVASCLSVVTVISLTAKPPPSCR